MDQILNLLSQTHWDHFVWYGVTVILLSSVGAGMGWIRHRPLALLFSTAALLVMTYFIAGMWVSLGRPPMRTQGETRLLYSFFVLIAGILVYSRWRYRWILSFSTILATVFIIINIVKPQIHSKTMMAALASPYFVPHVISYMFAYGMLGISLIIGLYAAYKRSGDHTELLRVMDNLAYTGIGFLLIGLILGAIWAKAAWGTYWGWDPKETWAAITLAAYLLFLHHRRFHPTDLKTSIWLLILSFLFLQMCWYGVNYLPSAKGSIHTYGTT